MVSMQLTSGWVGVLEPTQQLKDMTQNIIYSLWGGAKHPWLCLMAKLLLFCLVWQFLFQHFFFTSLTKCILWNSGKTQEAKAFLQIRNRGDGEEGVICHQEGLTSSFLVSVLCMLFPNQHPEKKHCFGENFYLLFNFLFISSSYLE